MPAGGAATNRIAKWNGSAWSTLGAGFDWDVYSLAAFDSGSGPALIAGGAFINVTGQRELRKNCNSQWIRLNQR